MANPRSSIVTRAIEVKNATSSASSVVEDGSTSVSDVLTDKGLKAWLTVFGGALMLFCCGQITAFGVFETYYAQHQLRGVSPSTISWIGSLQLWVLYFSVRNLSPPARCVAC